jgi:hypothetical protein
MIDVSKEAVGRIVANMRARPRVLVHEDVANLIEALAADRDRLVPQRSQRNPTSAARLSALSNLRF